MSGSHNAITTFVISQNVLIAAISSTLAVQFSTYADTPVNVTVSMSILSVATNLARILRNICSNNKENQSLILSHDIPHFVKITPIYQA